MVERMLTLGLAPATAKAPATVPAPVTATATATASATASAKALAQASVTEREELMSAKGSTGSAPALRQQIVETMAESLHESDGHFVSFEKASEYERTSYRDAASSALDELLRILRATGWQIVPKAATAPMIKATSEAFAEVNQAIALAAVHGFHLTSPEDGKYAVERAYEAMLAAAPRLTDASS